MVKRIVIDRTLDFLMKMAKKAVLTIDGIEVEQDFHSQVIEGDTIKTYVYLSDGHGVVSSAKLVDAIGIELDNYNVNIETSEDGLMIAFTLSVQLKGVVHS